MSRLSSQIVIWTDPEKDRDKTPSQTEASNTLDSRSYQRSVERITPKRIREIRKDPTVRLVRQAVVAPIIHTPWSYEEKKNAPSGAVDLIQSIFEPRRNWLLQGALYGCLDFGWMPYELVYSLNRGNQTIIKKFKQLLHDFTTILIYVDNGDFAGFANWPSLSVFWGNNGKLTGEEILIRELYAMNMNLEVEGTDWYGISCSSSLDSICENWDDVNKSANRYDKKVSGASWVIYYPVGKTQFRGEETDNYTIATELLSVLEASGGIAIPDEIQEVLDEDSFDTDKKGKWRVELISASSSTQASFNDRQKYLDNLKVRIFGIPERSLLEGKFGTKAEAETHAEIGLSTVDTKHRLIVDLLNEQAVNKILRLNYGEDAVDTVGIRVAPLVSSQFGHLKEIYRLIVQNPQLALLEAKNLNMQRLREELSIPVHPGAEAILDIELDSEEDPNSEDSEDSEDNGESEELEDINGEEDNG